MIKTREELIKKYIDFFKSKDHKEIPSASLIPENDPTVLFTTAGMHPLVPYILGQRHPLGKRLVNVQKCVRTGDIDEVGDETHHTFFEMLGNWSLGDAEVRNTSDTQRSENSEQGPPGYWKEEAVMYLFEFLTLVLEIPKENLAVSCFGGDDNIPKDDVSAKVWMDLGIPEARIGFFGKDENWWGPAGETGPCGPDMEIYYWATEDAPPEKYEPGNKNWVEIGTDVLLEYNKTSKGSFVPLEQRTIDFGGGVERILAVLGGLSDNYKTTIFKPIIRKIEEISGKKYKGKEKAFRIVADHLRAATFILGDRRGVKPSNIGQGYVLRRLIRRAIRYGKILGIERNFTKEIAEVIVPMYKDAKIENLGHPKIQNPHDGFSGYPELEKNKEFIYFQLEEEENRFRETLEKGLKKFENITKGSEGTISGKNAFLLFQSYGFPIEMTVELAKEKGREVDRKSYEDEAKKHQELSRTSSAGTFKSGLADDSEATTKLHTATHLLNEVLRRVLGDEVKQKGSNISPERLRFDFSFSRKLTDEEVKEVESLVNEKIEAGLEVTREELSLAEAMESGAQAEFGAKYPDIVSVFTVLDGDDERGWFSKEICTGPHVANTRDIGKFKILKEQSVAAGVRRIKAVIE